MAEKTVEKTRKHLQPHYAVRESKDGKLQVRVELPGVRKEDLEVRVENNEMRIVGRREQPKDPCYVLRERPQGNYLQTFTLDETVDQSKVDAKLEKGVLSVTLELKEYVKPRTVKIRGE